MERKPPSKSPSAATTEASVQRFKTSTDAFRTSTKASRSPQASGEGQVLQGS
jgi:hypothetical protein